jgi:hypothetical protein
LRPFNIDARLNGAYIALGLLYGKGDMTRTLDVSTRAGQDSDCNPSSAAGILGVMLGYKGIPEEWKSGIAPIADKKFDYTNYSFNDIIRSTMERAFKVIRASGGTVTETEAVVPYQSARAAKLEQWDMGIPKKTIGAKDAAAWAWKGAWTEQIGGREKKEFEGMAAEGAGSEAELKFDGTAIVLVGRYSQSGGRADVYLDGKKSGMPLDAYITERTHDNALWHVYDLKPGAHTVRVVTRGDADSRSRGKRVVINGAITYRAR